MEKISAVYQIVNTVTNDKYVGSSKDVMRRWASHKEPSRWERYPNSSMYQDMQRYGVDKFRFQILAPVMPKRLKQVEQEFIEMLNPTYNSMYAKGEDVEKRLFRRRKWSQSNKGKEYMRVYQRKLRQTDKGREASRKVARNYGNQICSYNGETLTLGALSMRFRRAGIEHPSVEAKKYLLHEQQLIDVKEPLK